MGVGACGACDGNARGCGALCWLPHHCSKHRTLTKKADEASTWRDQRELLLNHYREYSSKWVNYVEAFGETPTAYSNAGRLYKELVDSDQVLRQQLRQLKSPSKAI